MSRWTRFSSADTSSSSMKMPQRGPALSIAPTAAGLTAGYQILGLEAALALDFYPDYGVPIAA
jgi:hypothetical protein